MDPVSLGGTSRASHQVVDDVEAVVLVVAGVDAAVGLLPHVVFQRRFVPEGFFTVQTLQTERERSRKVVGVNRFNLFL